MGASGRAPLPLPSGHHPHAAVDHTVGHPAGAPPSVPHHRTGDGDTPPPPLKATAFAVPGHDASAAPTASHMAPQPPSSHTSVSAPKLVHSSFTCASASASYCACVTDTWPGSSVDGGRTLWPAALR